MANDARDSEFHDILVIPKRGHRLQQVEVEKAKGANQGKYKAFATPPLDEAGHRKVLALAGVNSDRGAGFSTLPIKEEPASSFWTCFLINAENLNFRNAWTAAEWNDDPGGPTERGIWGTPDFEVLVAGPRGSVYLVRKVGNAAPVVSPVDLRFEGEIWTQLRSGLVAGRVKYYRYPDTPGGKVVPLVNVTALAVPAQPAVNQ